MILELLASTVLWASTEILDPEIELRVSCDRVELDINASPKATPVLVKFYVKDMRYKFIWSYRVPMKYDAQGNILLEPTKYWIEEIRNNDSVTLEVENKQYTFNLKGSKKALEQCD